VTTAPIARDGTSSRGRHRHFARCAARDARGSRGEERQHDCRNPFRALFLPAAEFERIVGDEPRCFRPFLNLLLDRYQSTFALVAELQGLPSEERL